jgi:hypothetical protein
LMVSKISPYILRFEKQSPYLLRMESGCIFNT